MDRATDYAHAVNLPEVWSELAEGQLNQNMVAEAIGPPDSPPRPYCILNITRSAGEEGIGDSARQEHPRKISDTPYGRVGIGPSPVSELSLT